MSTVIKEECKVPAFEYFQIDNTKWYSDLTVGFNIATDNIFNNYKKQLDIEKKSVNKEIITIEDNSDELVKVLGQLNEISNKYLLSENENYYNINLNKQIEQYISAYEIFKDKKNIIETLAGPEVINNTDLENSISQLTQEIKVLISLINEKTEDHEEYVKSANITIKELEEIIIEITKKIAQLDISILEFIAKKNLEDIRIKHYDKLFESYKTSYETEKEKNKNDLEELKKTLQQKEKQLEMLSDDKIKERVKQEFKTKTISDATESNNSTQEKGTRRSVIVGNPYFDNSIINDKFPLPPEYEMTEEILYNGNDNFRNIGTLLLDKDKNALTSKESKLFSMKEKGFDSVVTINMNNINNELEKYQ